MNATTDALLGLVDAVDTEANIVTHAVIGAQSTVQALADELGVFPGVDSADERAWIEVTSRLMRHLATLVEFLDSLPPANREILLALDDAGITPTSVGAWAEYDRIPDPPRPRHFTQCK